jgi:hypothetical protein
MPLVGLRKQLMKNYLSLEDEEILRDMYAY